VYVFLVCDFVLVLLYMACLDVAAARCCAEDDQSIERGSVGVFCTSLLYVI